MNIFITIIDRGLILFRSLLQIKSDRLWEIDFLRGIAIVMMILYHFLWDLHYFNIIFMDFGKGFWLYFARITAALFIGLVGVSLALSRIRVKVQKQEIKYTNYFYHGLGILCWGLLITIVTLILFPAEFIVFGILHFIGISIMLTYPFLQYTTINFWLGIIFIALGLLIKNYTVNTFWLLWLGLVPSHWSTIDYFPILPWLGVVLLGLFVGNKIYADYTSPFPKTPPNNLINIVSLIGQKSLFIYLIHQPVLFTIIYLFSQT